MIEHTYKQTTLGKINVPKDVETPTDTIYLQLKSSFPKRYKSILIVFMKMTFFYLDPYILLIFNLSC